MRSIRLVLSLLVALPAPASAKAWQGVNPGQSTRSDVVARFGEPSTQGRLGERTAMVYKGDQAIAGTRQAQFFTREDGLVLEVVVWPQFPLEKEAVEGTYGKAAHRTFTDDFRPVWQFKATGVTVFFGKEGTVEAISFKPADAAAARQPREAPPAKGSAPRGGE